MSAYTVCVVERGALAVVRGYDDQGEASRAMKGVGPTGHVLRGALLHKVHPKMDPAVERKVEQALRDGTHPALPLARLASPPGARKAVEAYLRDPQGTEYAAIARTLTARGAVAAAEALAAIKAGAAVRGLGEQRDGARFSGARHFRL